MDGDVVVVPAEGLPGCRLGGFLLGIGNDVVDFEAVGVGASVDDAAVVSGEDGSSEAVVRRVVGAVSAVANSLGR